MIWLQKVNCEISTGCARDTTTIHYTVFNVYVLSLVKSKTIFEFQEQIDRVLLEATSYGRR